MAEFFKTMSEDFKRELQDAVSSGGVAKLKDLIQSKTDDWRKIPLDIAITGATGAGKSSFINAIRGITADDEGGAHVDVVEATKEVKRYTHPKNSSMVLWDLPGVGTPRFPKKTYLKEVDFEKYDFFLILFAGRFREDDLWLAKTIRSLKKRFYFVRTKMEHDVNDNKHAHPNTHFKGNVIEKVRTDCQNNLKDCQTKMMEELEDRQDKLEDYDLTRASVFLIDNHSPKKFEFDLLTRTLIDEAPCHKKEAMILSMSVLTDGLLEKKVEALQERIYKVAFMSALGAAIPFPGVGFAMDIAILNKEVNFFRSQFGLDVDTINEHAKVLKLETAQLREKLCLRSFDFTATAKSVTQTIVSTAAASEMIESALPMIIPLLGSTVSAGLSYGVTVSSLRYFLNILKEDAQKINKEMLQNSLQ